LRLLGDDRLRPHPSSLEVILVGVRRTGLGELAAELVRLIGGVRVLARGRPRLAPRFAPEQEGGSRPRQGA
jgi:hypothetical protein